MVDSPNVPRIPYLFGVTLTGSGVANTQVVALNRSTGEQLIGDTDANQVVVFDAANFDTLYVTGQVIEFQNVGGSIGIAIATISADVVGFDSVSLTAAAAPTVSINL